MRYKFIDGDIESGGVVEDDNGNRWIVPPAKDDETYGEKYEDEQIDKNEDLRDK